MFGLSRNMVLKCCIHIFEFLSDSTAPSQVPYRSCKFTTGVQSTVRCSNYNTVTSRMESEFAVEHTGMPIILCYFHSMLYVLLHYDIFKITVVSKHILFQNSMGINLAMYHPKTGMQARNTWI